MIMHVVIVFTVCQIILIQYGTGVLYFAAYYGHISVIKYLLMTLKMDPSIRDPV